MSDIIVISSDDEEKEPSAKPTVSTSKLNSCGLKIVDDYEHNNGFSNSYRYSPSPERLITTPDASPKNKFQRENSLSPWSKAVRAVHALSDSDTSDVDTSGGKVTSFKRNSPDRYSSDGFSTDVVFIDEPKKKRKSKDDIEKQRAQKKETLAIKKLQREKLQEEKKQKKQEAAIAKALKSASMETIRSMKPGECMKLVTVLIDSTILDSDYGGELLTALRNSNLKYRIQGHEIPSLIKWEREVTDVRLGDDMKVTRVSKIQKETPVLLVWSWEQLIDLVSNGKLQEKVQELQYQISDGKLSIVVHDLEDYFRFQKTQKKRDFRNGIVGGPSHKPKGKECAFAAAPEVPRGDLEFVLAELQILFGINFRSVSKLDVPNVICQFSKAIAEAPFKQEKHKKDAERLEWYASADSRDCVAIDKDGNGLSRLWQQQICQFPLAGIEVSEAIASVYTSPSDLMSAYEACQSKAEGEKLLQDLPVRRGAGPLSSLRRVGPQLSKKIYTFLTSENGTVPLHRD